jgi:hypothetical protein
MPRKPGKPRANPRPPATLQEYIQRVKGVQFREFIWIETHTGKLIRIPSKSNRVRVRPNIRVNSKSFPVGEYYVHQHLHTKRDLPNLTAKPTPSRTDICGLSNLMVHRKAEASKIVSFDYMGKVAGTTKYRLDRPLTLEEQEILTGKKPFVPKQAHPASEEISTDEMLREFHVNLTLDFMPQPGYRFNKQTLFFEKK